MYETTDLQFYQYYLIFTFRLQNLQFMHLIYKTTIFQVEHISNSLNIRNQHKVFYFIKNSAIEGNSFPGNRSMLFKKANGRQKSVRAKVASMMMNYEGRRDETLINQNEE